MNTPGDQATVLTLPTHVDAGAAAALFRAWSARVAQLTAIDLSQVKEIDSTGVALVRALHARAARDTAGTPPFELRGVPSRYIQLLHAHRLDNAGA